VVVFLGSTAVDHRRTIADLLQIAAAARWQTRDIQYRRLRQLFDRHYREQIRQVDVLIDRIRALGGGRQYSHAISFKVPGLPVCSAGTGVQDNWLNELLDAHVSTSCE